MGGDVKVVSLQCVSDEVEGVLHVGDSARCDDEVVCIDEEGEGVAVRVVVKSVVGQLLFDFSHDVIESEGEE